MRNTKDKTLAALMAFFGGIIGLQYFYLGKNKQGFFMIILALFTMGVVSSVIGVLQAIAYLTMSEEKFDYKYNHPDSPYRKSSRRTRYRSYERRYNSQKSSGEKESGYRRDRRINKREYNETKKKRDSKRSGPYRRPVTKRSTKNTRKHRKQTLKKIQEFKEVGIQKFKEFDIEGSILEFQNILKIDPQNVAAHFNLACAWSQLEKTEKSIFHISEAVRAGFDDFERIRKHDKLAYVRIQPEWEEFSKNGFVFDVKEEEDDKVEVEAEFETNERMVKKTPEEVIEKDENSGDLLEHLNRLKEQREKGIISETEFELERRKLMSS